jgi:WD40 repeat protein
MVQGLKLAQAIAPSNEGPLTEPLPRELGEYELLEQLARGGMGVIYRARQRDLDRIVAVKLLLLGPRASPDFVKRFRAEASAAAGLHHPNIVAIHQVGVHQGEHYLAMDLVDGPDLAKFIKDQPLPARQAAGYLKTIAEAIHYAHERGILHRDLKPSNVLIDSNDQPRVTDFGLAKRFDGDSSLTLSGQVLGSPSYMPPEQAGTTRHKVGRRSDVYSLGAMLYHMVVGRPPFVGEGLNQTLDQVLNHEPISPRLLNPAVPRDLETICLKCLEKEPARRFQTAQALADELGRFLRDEPIRARPVSRPERVWRWCRRKPALATLLLLLQVVGVAGLGGILWQWRRAEHNADAERLSREQAEALGYATDMSLAQKHLEAGNLARARNLLQRHRPGSSSEKDRRGWEWRYLWQRSRGDEIGTLDHNQAQVWCLNYSPDGKLLASGDGQGMLRLWDPTTRQLVASAASPNGVPLALHFAPNGRRLASGGFRHGVRVLDWDGAKLSSRPPLWADGIVLGLWLGDLELIAVDSERQIRQRWELPSGRELDSGEIVGESSSQLESWSVFSADGALLATSTNNVVLLWAARTGALLAALTNHAAAAHPLAFSPDGRILATGDFNGILKLWSVQTHQEMASAVAHQLIAEYAAFSPDGKRLVTCGYDYALRLWDVAPLHELATLRGHLGEVYQVQFSPDGRQIASASADGTVKFWSPVPKAAQSGSWSLPPDLRLWSLAPDGQWLLLLFTDHTFSLWNLQAAEPALTSSRYPLGATNVTAAAVLAGGRLLALGCSDGRVDLYEAPSMKRVIELPRLDAEVATFGCSRDGHTLVAQSTNFLMKSWSLPEGRELGSFSYTNHFYYARALVSPDGHSVLTADLRGAAGLWSPEGSRRLTFQGSEGAMVTGAAFFRDGRRMATCSTDKTARIWDLATVRPILTLYSDLNGLRSVALSPDEKRLVVGDDLGRPRKVKVFDLATAQEVAVLSGHNDSILDVAFWPDGNAIVSVSRDTLNIWRAPSLAEIETEITKGP